jgi:hypothetical protein
MQYHGNELEPGKQQCGESATPGRGRDERESAGKHKQQQRIVKHAVVTNNNGNKNTSGVRSINGNANENKKSESTLVLTDLHDKPRDHAGLLCMAHVI